MFIEKLTSDFFHISRKLVMQVVMIAKYLNMLTVYPQIGV